jgi:hypothetical protein
VHLRGGELVELVNLTPNGRVRLTLPKIYPTFTTHIGSRRHEHRPRLGTVILEPEEMRPQLVFHTSLVVRQANVDYVDTTVITEKRYL